MPARPVNLLLNLLARLTDSTLIHIIEFQACQIEILRSRVQSPIRTTKAERNLLLKLAEPLGSKVKALIKICSYRTLARWKAEAAGQKLRRDKLGRPPSPESLRATIFRLAEENPTWGYSRILGELNKLGQKAARTTIKNILRELGIHPSPERKTGDWKTFLRRHAKTIWACDFVSRKVLTKFGIADCFVLFFIHLESRRVYLAGVTIDPHYYWLAQQARNVSIFFNELPEKPRFLIHDRDGKFDGFERILASDGIVVKKLPPKTPNLNAFAERWVRSFSDEVLNHFIIFGEAHMRLLATEFIDFYNLRRPHQSKGNRPLGSQPNLKPSKHGAICCEERLGGLLRHYYRKAA